MSIKPINHYSMTSAPHTVYDEEAMTVLELVGRVAGKANECINAVNKHFDECEAKLEKGLSEGMKNHVDAWLDAHPEATTTVTDEAITMQKLAPSLRLQLENEYVTPAMYGAVGDGEADDTNKLQAMFNSGARVFVPAGTYKVTKQLNAFNSIQFDKNAVIEFYPSSAGAVCLQIQGGRETLVEGKPCTVSGKSITISGGFSNIGVGDYVCIYNSELVSTWARSYDTKRDILQVESVSGDTITFTSAPEWDYMSVSVAKYTFAENVIVDGVNINCMAKVSDSYGVNLKYCRNATVRNCHIVGFDYSQINLMQCTLCDVHSNCCEVNYTESLQYGIVITSCQDITVHDNKVNSQRTAIDITRVANKVTVANNTVKGSINTHSSANVVITNNTVSDGTILIRGKNTNVLGNNVTNHSLYCLDIEEMGIEGGHVIANNTFNGWCSTKLYQSNIMVVNNRFNVTKVTTYESRSSVLRLMTVNPDKKDGLVIRGNWIEYKGDTPPLFAVDTYFGCNTLYNVVCSDNVIINFDTGLDFEQKSGTKGSNLIIRNNFIKCHNYGINHRLVDNTQIVGNTIIGIDQGNIGIWRVDTTIDTNGFILTDNYIANFKTGNRIGDSGDLGATVYDNNVYVNCTTESTGISGNTTRVPNELFIADSTGAVYQLKVSTTGELSAVKQ